MNAIKLFWLWLGFWTLIFTADAANNALLDRQTGISWMWVHLFFWLTRDIPAMVTGLYIAVKFVKQYGKLDAFSALITVEFSIASAAWFRVLFLAIYNFVFSHRHLFHGGEKPGWWPF